MKILVGYDGSSCSEAALGQLSRMGIPAGSEITILAVADLAICSGECLTQSEIFDQLSLAYRPEFTKATEFAKEMHRRVGEAACAVHATLPACHLIGDARVGMPALVLLDVAKEIAADLIVLGWHGGSVFHRWMFGSVSHSVLKDTRFPVQIVNRMPARMNHPTRLAVYLEDASAYDALDTIAVHLSHHAWPDGTELRLLLPGSRSKSFEQVDGLLHPFVRGNLHPSLFVLPDGKEQSLVDQVRSWEADTVLLSWHDGLQRNLELHFLENLMRHAPCSVRVIPVTAHAAVGAGGSQ